MRARAVVAGMSYHAVRALRDAYDATRAFLLPVEVGRWGRLAVVALFLGGSGAGVLNVQGSVPVEGGAPLPVPGGGVPVGGAAVLLVVVAAALAVALALAVVSAVMEFVMYDALRRDAVSLRADVRRHLGRGLRLFAFRVGVGVVTLVVVAAFGAVLVVPALAVVGLAAAAVGVATTSFVVPTMLATGAGVLDGWRRVWPVLRNQPAETAVYGAVWVGLAVARGLVVGTAVALGAALLAVPFGLAAAGLLALARATPLALLPLALLALVYAAGVLVVFAVVNVPVVTYLRYVALFVLGDLDAPLDLVPETRETVRAAREDGADGGTAGEGGADEEGGGGEVGDDGADGEGGDDGDDGADGEDGDDGGEDDGADEGDDGDGAGEDDGADDGGGGNGDGGEEPDRPGDGGG